ncbi:MAG: right-handed parallel beta-helix repeat-containing protein [Chitinophagales bacterium]|nr:right-handed parallel beta-helix repeat-containing protein [Chitinophagales bacterium]MDW8393038.1 right-handed parallel beta-helix repeat-containing protein [Chitinophagales bacterium]
MRWWFFPACCLTVAVCAQDQPVVLDRGLRITRSCTIQAGEYVLDASPDLNEAVVVIEGEDIVVDFQQAVLRSSLPVTQPDRFQGVAILIRNSRRITLRHARIHGYKVAIRAENVEHLVIEHCDLSYNYRQRLNSTPFREDISDWLSFHQNENDQWLRYGAALYLRRCSYAVIRHNRVTGGQCALMMTHCHYARITGNEFTFNSGIGIGLYRSSHNVITGNKLDFNIRGYSHGRYNRGQDSAGILLYEQSSNNLIAGNSATHCGDGLFLWAGQYTMDTGQGGSNNNLVYANNFSDASNNGIEATFSSNTLVGNRLHRCDYGIWAGYSYQTVVAANELADNRVGIAIEHGQNNTLRANTFQGDRLAIQLWANEQQPASWKLIRYRNTESKNYTITHNFFKNVGKVADFRQTTAIRFDSNCVDASVGLFTDRTAPADSFTEMDSSVCRAERLALLRRYLPDSSLAVPDPPPLPGRQYIRMTEWGPYDYRRPLLWLDSIGSEGTFYLQLLGPPGKWRLRRAQGLSLARLGGSLPDTLQVRPLPNFQGTYRITCAYLGEAGTDEFGRTFSPDILRPYDFSFQFERYALEWNRSFFALHPHKTMKPEWIAHAARKGKPVYSDTVTDLHFSWWQSPLQSVPSDYFALQAEATVNLPAGPYEVLITADDGVQFFVDDRMLLDALQPPPDAYADQFHHVIPVTLTGMHRFRILYVEHTGLAALSFRLRSLSSQP